MLHGEMHQEDRPKREESSLIEVFLILMQFQLKWNII